MLLGSFIKKYINKCRKYNLFKIIISGQLPFSQDLIQSKIPSEKGLVRRTTAFFELEAGEQVIPNEFLLLRREIINGTITYTTLELLEKVCTSQEYKTIMELEVQSAAFYYDSDCVEDKEEFLNAILSDKGSNSYESSTSRVIDTRTHKWHPIFFENFVGDLLKKRAELKPLKNDPIAQATQQALKLIINCLWGDITSTFFALNNTICSEIVTNAIRNKVWMLVKAVNGNMSITDGCPYSLMGVSYLKDGAKPGLSSLSSYYIYSKHRSIEIKPLKGIDWKGIFQNNLSYMDSELKNLDQYVQEHIAEFWDSYGLSIDFKIEHKLERCFLRCAYFKKANYLMIIYNNKAKGKYKYNQIIRVI